MTRPTAISVIEAMRTRGLSYHSIAAELNQRGYLAPRGGRWFGTSVRQTLISASKEGRKIRAPRPVLKSPDQDLFDAWHANFVSAGSDNVGADEYQ